MIHFILFSDDSSKVAYLSRKDCNLRNESVLDSGMNERGLVSRSVELQTQQRHRSGRRSWCKHCDSLDMGNTIQCSWRIHYRHDKSCSTKKIVSLVIPEAFASEFLKTCLEGVNLLMIISMRSFIHDPLTTISNKETFLPEFA